MERFQMQLAKLNIEARCRYPYAKRFCREYLCGGTPDFAVSVTEEQIDEEIRISGVNPSRGYAECICVYREIAKHLPFYDRLVFHGAVIACEGNGYLFTAPSGTGKTTHVRLWQQVIDGVEIVNGDKPILHITDGAITAYATPYAGKEGYQNGGSVALRGICILQRGETNRIRRVTTGEALTQLMHQVYMPQEAEAVMKTIDLLDKMFTALPLYVLECTISKEAVEVAYEALTGTTHWQEAIDCG